MQQVEFTYWKDGDYRVGFLNDFSDYLTQGKSDEELKEQLCDVFFTLTGAAIIQNSLRGNCIRTPDTF